MAGQEGTGNSSEPPACHPPQYTAWHPTVTSQAPGGHTTAPRQAFRGAARSLCPPPQGDPGPPSPRTAGLAACIGAPLRPRPPSSTSKPPAGPRVPASRRLQQPLLPSERHSLGIRCPFQTTLPGHSQGWRRGTFPHLVLLASSPHTLRRAAPFAQRSEQDRLPTSRQFARNLGMRPKEMGPDSSKRLRIF